MENPYERGKALAERHNPGLEESLEARYGALLPGMPQDLISFVYGQHYDRPGLSLHKGACVYRRLAGTGPQGKTRGVLARCWAARESGRSLQPVE